MEILKISAEVDFETRLGISQEDDSGAALSITTPQKLVVAAFCITNELYE